MSEETYYIKSGRRYVPISYYDSNMSEAFPEGATLVIKRANLRMYRRDVPMELASAVATLEWMKDALSTAIISSCTMRSAAEPLTEEQRAAWEEFVRLSGPAGRRISLPSAAEIASNTINSLKEDIMRKIEHPAVKEAYEHLQTIIALTENHALD